MAAAAFAAVAALFVIRLGKYHKAIFHVIMYAGYKVFFG